MTTRPELIIDVARNVGDLVATGTVDSSATTTTFVDTELTFARADQLTGRSGYVYAGTGNGSAFDIVNFNTSTFTVTFSPPISLDNTSKYVIFNRSNYDWYVSVIEGALKSLGGTYLSEKTSSLLLNSNQKTYTIPDGFYNVGELWLEDSTSSLTDCDDTGEWSTVSGSPSFSAVSSSGRTFIRIAITGTAVAKCTVDEFDVTQRNQLVFYARSSIDESAGAITVTVGSVVYSLPSLTANTWKLCEIPIVSEEDGLTSFQLSFSNTSRNFDIDDVYLGVEQFTLLPSNTWFIRDGKVCLPASYDGRRLLLVGQEAVELPSNDTDDVSGDVSSILPYLVAYTRFEYVSGLDWQAHPDLATKASLYLAQLRDLANQYNRRAHVDSRRV